MTDQCKHCTVRGDYEKCIVTPCGHHENWINLQRIRRLEDGYSTPSTHPDIEVKVEAQGAPVVSGGCVQQRGGRVRALIVDLDTSHCEVVADGSYRGVPLVDIQTTKDSTGLHPDSKVEDITEISFPEYEGWDIWVSNIYGSNLAVCLIKD